MDEYDGDRFFTKKGGKGKTVATPLFLCLVCIELSDFVFAVDSIPAVLGVSKVRSVLPLSVAPAPAGLFNRCALDFGHLTSKSCGVGLVLCCSLFFLTFPINVPNSLLD